MLSTKVKSILSIDVIVTIQTIECKNKKDNLVAKLLEFSFVLNEAYLYNQKVVFIL